MFPFGTHTAVFKALTCLFFIVSTVKKKKACIFLPVTPQVERKTCVRASCELLDGGLCATVNRCVTTSGRRIEQMGNLKATMVHFLIGLSWYAGATPDDMVELYKRFYSDVR